MDRNQALQHIVRQARAGELVFPTRMAATLRLQRLLGDPECHLDQVADMVLAEPLVAARLVAIANSVAYTRFGGHVSNVRKAVSLLGFRPLRALVAVIVVRQLAEEIKDPRLKHQARLLWHHSAQVAALAKILAREFTAIDPDTAMFAGVIHEIDGFYLLSRAGELPELLADTLDAGGHDARASLSACILQALKVPPMIATAVGALFADRCHIPPLTAGDILLLANSLATARSPLTEWAGPLPDKGSVGPEADFKLEGKSLQGVLSDCTEEIQAVMDALLS